MVSAPHKLVRILVMLAILPMVGSAGFMTIEGWNFLDALYMSVITLTTVGFREVHELSDVGRVFVIVYLVIGVGAFLYGMVQTGELILRAELDQWLGKRKMDNRLKKLENHVIVCGFGRMGRTLCRHLADKGVPFVVVDRDEQALAECHQNGWPCLVRDATDDQSLVLARIESARGLAAVLTDDADNVYLVLTARLLEKNLTIMARASDDASVPKLRRAGADRVVSLYEAGALKLAQLFANPNVEEFVEIFTTEGRQLDLAEIHVAEKSPFSGRLLGETNLRERGVIVVAIKRKNGELLMPPSKSTRIHADDALIAFGRVDAIARLLAR